MSSSPTSNLLSTGEQVSLALSGGGFRATLFHLGVVRALAETEVLRSVTQVSSVSGGSILAAHLVLNWNKYAGETTFDASAFDEAAQEIIHLVRRNVRGRITQTVLWQTAWRMVKGVVRRASHVISEKWEDKLDASMSRSTATASLQRSLDRHLFEGASLRALGSPGSDGNPGRPTDRPVLWIMATNLTAADACCFSHDGFRPTLDKGITPIGSELISIAKAVCASAAFPGFFPALKLLKSELHWTDIKFAGNCWYVADGGIVDNLGATGLMCLAEKYGPPAHILISDASGQLSWNATNRMGFTFGTAARTLEVMTGRIVKTARSEISRQAGVGGLPDPVILSIDSSHNLKNLVGEGAQHALPNVRTDFDHFTDAEISALVRHGYAIAWQSIQARWPNLVAKPTILQSCGGMQFVDTGPKATEVVEKLHKSSSRNTWLLSPRLPVFWINCALLIVIGIGVWLGLEIRERRIRQADAEIAKKRQDEITVAHEKSRWDRSSHVASLVRLFPWAPDTRRMEAQPIPRDDLPDLGGFQVIKEERVFDLRGWRPNPSPAKSGENHDVERESSAIVYVQMRIKKERPRDILSIPITTNGTDVVIDMPDNAFQHSLLEEQAADGSQDKRLVLRIVVPDRKIKPNEEFEVSYRATFWNALQEPDTTFVGIPIYSNEEEVSGVIVWPDSIPIPDCECYRGSLDDRKAKPVRPADWGHMYKDQLGKFTAWHIQAGPSRSSAILQWSWGSSRN